MSSRNKACAFAESQVYAWYFFILTVEYEVRSPLGSEKGLGWIEDLKGVGKFGDLLIGN